LGAALNERRDLINRTNQMAQEQAADRYIYGPLGDGLGNGRREFFDLGVETVNQLNEAL